MLTPETRMTIPRRRVLAAILAGAFVGSTAALGGDAPAAAAADADADAVLQFWFVELEPRDWWRKDPELDRRIESRFGGLLEAAVRGALAHWRTTPRGRLAEIIVLDQFTRNIHRDSAGAFANDALALRLAEEAVAAGADLELPVEERRFVYMPYMHSESAAVHETAMRLFATPGLEKNLEFEHRHKAVIDRFGRFPHRNALLGRPSTAEEIEFLKQPGSSF
jgi:uncharacterized protein (DUF924 family)